MGFTSDFVAKLTKTLPNGKKEKLAKPASCCYISRDANFLLLFRRSIS